MKLNLYDALHQPNEIIKSLKDADIATLTLVLSYITCLLYTSDAADE